MARDVRGAGRGGGLLFAGVLLFLGYLAATAVAGALRFVAAGLLVAAAAALIVNVSRRR